MSVNVRRFEYVVWFRSSWLPPDDQDYEWPAVFAIEADTAEAAQAWGDHLSHSYSARSGEVFVSSHVETLLDATKLDQRISGRRVMPLVAYGREATDYEIGW